MAKVAILSDSHDNVGNLEQVLEAVRKSGATVLLHCGDLCAPFIINHLAAGFRGEIHIVFGNNDGDGRLLQSMAAQHEHLHLHGIYHELAVGTRRVAMIHYPEPARRIAQSGELDLVCYGHNHTARAEKIDDCWLVNPGEIMGMRGAATWGLYDCDTHQFELKTIAP